MYSRICSWTINLFRSSSASFSYIRSSSLFYILLLSKEPSKFPFSLLTKYSCCSELYSQGFCCIITDKITFALVRCWQKGASLWLMTRNESNYFFFYKSKLLWNFEARLWRFYVYIKYVSHLTGNNLISKFEIFN